MKTNAKEIRFIFKETEEPDGTHIFKYTVSNEKWLEDITEENIDEVIADKLKDDLFLNILQDKNISNCILRVVLYDVKLIKEQDISPYNWDKIPAVKKVFTLTIEKTYKIEVCKYKIKIS